MAGSWEQDRVELIVDVPVWTPGCFQGECFSYPASAALSSITSRYR